MLSEERLVTRQERGKPRVLWILNCKKQQRALRNCLLLTFPLQDTGVMDSDDKSLRLTRQTNLVMLNLAPGIGYLLVRSAELPSPCSCGFLTSVIGYYPLKVCEQCYMKSNPTFILNKRGRTVLDASRQLHRILSTIQAAIGRINIYVLSPVPHTIAADGAWSLGLHQI